RSSLRRPRLYGYMRLPAVCEAVLYNQPFGRTQVCVQCGRDRVRTARRRSGRAMTSAGSVPSTPGDATGSDKTPFRFYDNRQKYLAFVNTCNEKAVVARRAAQELHQLRPVPPALRLFDAGMGDATVLSRLMSSVHRDFPAVPPVAGGQESSPGNGRPGRGEERG